MGDLSTLVTAIKAASLVKTLEGKGPFTVFAPTNEAFKAVPAATLSHLLDPANKKDLVNLLEYHVVSGDFRSTQLKDMQMPASLNGQTAQIRVANDGGIFINSAKVTAADNDATNGVVHEIDAVLMPPSPPAPKQDIVELAESVKDLSTLVTAIKAASLVKTLEGKGPFTVFAPTNEAFKAV